MPIHLLPTEIASQIAAGEVVERPASVVKELVENALDAGAGSIVVNIEAAGRVLIQVADDGAGIPADELPLAVERHATSKLSKADDLFHITTLGFRGEALASIGSVSRMMITSRTADSVSGVRLVVEGGDLGRAKKVGAPIGTEVRVEDLFYNVPARLKFLKQDMTERRAIDAFLTRYALAYPAVRFKLVEGETPSLQTSGDGDRRAILAALYGVDTAHQMLEVQSDEADYQLSGYISPTALTRSNRKDITFFINGRWVQDVSLTTALLQAYRTLLMVGRYPMAVLFIRVPPEEVDVNVHPAKAEVRFRHPDQVFSFVQHSVRKTLLAYTPVPQVTPPSLWAAPSQTVDPAWSLGHAPDQPSVGNSRVSEDQALDVAPAPESETSTGPLQQAAIPNLPLLRLIGQVGATYLVAEGPDGLYLIDQHAAHERVLFEKLMVQHERKSVASQTLLTPAVVHLPPESAKLLDDQLPLLQDLGFQVDPFGPNSYQVRAIPILFGGSDPTAALHAVVEDFEEDETPLQTELEARLAARVCKRMAVKAGQALSPDEQRALLNDLEACTSPRTCPHGRPTMIHLSVDLLERQFGRKGARA
ncbi:MAG: DNA mismatch repair endonuclease MutL [Anaerolineales bacterium]|jgi:DNA mismatch repair protein MutL